MRKIRNYLSNRCLSPVLPLSVIAAVSGIHGMICTPIACGFMAAMWLIINGAFKRV